MGCDIHMYVEYGNKESNKERVEKGEELYWNSFGGRINAGRNYPMFGILSKGVRTDCKDAFVAKGIPEDLGYYSFDDFTIYISETPNDNHVTLEKALDWNKRCGCKLYLNNEGKPWRIAGPDWHSCSWLTIEEYEKALEMYDNTENNWGYAVEYHAILSAMKTLECGGKNDVRLVFWFDN